MQFQTGNRSHKTTKIVKKTPWYAAALRATRFQNLKMLKYH